MIANLVSALIWPLVVIFITVYLVKIGVKQYKKRRKTKKEEMPRGETERLYVGIKSACKSSSMGKHKSVYVKGDSAVPAHRIGDTATGIIPKEDEYCFFVRSRWWKIWETPRLIHVEPEFMGDLNAGNIVIKGKGIDPISEREYYITPPSYYHEEIKPDKLAERRSNTVLKDVSRLLDRDINDDTSFVVKHAIRGSGELAMLDLYSSGQPPKKSKTTIEQKREQKYREAQEERKQKNMNTAQWPFQKGGESV